MKNTIDKGRSIREQSKAIVIEFMSRCTNCKIASEGKTQTELFKECGFDWGKYDKAPSTQQQYWFIALLRELEKENKIEQTKESGPWRLK